MGPTWPNYALSEARHRSKIDIEYIAATNCQAICPHNYWFGHIAYQGMQLLNGQTDHAAAIVPPLVRGLVAPGTESFVARARKNYGANGAVPSAALERMNELIHCLAARCVVSLRPIDRDARDSTLFSIENFLIDGHALICCYSNPADRRLAMRLAGSHSSNAAAAVSGPAGVKGTGVVVGVREKRGAGIG